jgi:polynucleotide 5'-kinase involved in rRNA processing
MSNNLDSVDIIRKRTNASYGEAKEALEMHNNDVVEAIIYLEKQNKVKAEASKNSHSNLGTTVKKLLKKGNETKFIIKKQDNVVVNLPVNVVVLTTAIVAPLTITGILVALFTNHKIAFEKSDGSPMEINNTLDKVSTAVTTAGSKAIEAIKKD